ncbi:hypothetical protein HD554DRAFT_2041611 [Boletus coccyginus]|nr:hypothetical protein HD554DRAFT_2041611 [Boletus coccyginus]
MKEQCRSLEEQNRILLANKPRKSAKGAVPDMLSAFDGEIQALAKKFGVLFEMFPPSGDILSRPLTGVCISSPASLDIVGPARYASTRAEEAAITAELDSMLPDHLRSLRSSNHFSQVFEQGLGFGRSNELHKLRGAAGDIFQLPSSHFSSEGATRRLEFPEIRELLGVEQQNPKYMTFPPLLFANRRVDMRTPFSNWQMLASILRIVLWGQTALTHTATRRPGAKSNGSRWNVNACTPGCLAWAAVIAIFIVSPDAEFSKHGVGATSQILYRNLFREYKCLLVTHWDSKNVCEVVKKVNNQVFGGASDKVAARSSAMNQEDLAAEIDAAMAAMDLPSDFSESLSEPDEDPESQTAIIGPTAATAVGPADFDAAATADDPPLPVPDSASSEFQQPLSIGHGRGRRGKGRATTRRNGK